MLVALLADIVSGAYEVVSVTAADHRRIAELCDRYADADIGYVDGAVLAITERLGESKLATLDRRHFGVLRPRHVDALRLVPGLIISSAAVLRRKGVADSLHRLGIISKLGPH